MSLYALNSLLVGARTPRLRPSSTVLQSVCSQAWNGEDGSRPTMRAVGGAAAPTSMEDDLCRLVLGIRSSMAMLAAVSIALVGSPGPAAIGATTLMLATSYLPYRRWAHLGPWLRRRPLLIIADAIASSWLLWRFGPGSLCVFVIVSIMPVAGLLGGMRLAVSFTVAELAAYEWAVSWHSPDESRWSAPFTVATPVWYVLAAALGVVLRRLLARHALAEQAARESFERAIVTDERVRLARDLHDSFGKTLHGIGLEAQALTLWIQRDTGAAAQRAAALVRSWDAAKNQLRQVIMGLREDTTPAALPDAIRTTVDKWSAQSGVEVVTHVECHEAMWLDAAACTQTLAVLGEALVNIERHADARRVSVTMRCRSEVVELCIRDDGRGFDPHDSQHSTGAHFGIVTMAERASRAGGALTVRSGLGEGTEVVLRFAARASRTSRQSRGVAARRQRKHGTK